MVRLISSSVFIKEPKDVWNKETTIGLSELAARVHAPPLVYQRSGDLIWFDDFESPVIKYYGVGEVYRTTKTAKFGCGSYSVKLKTGSTNGNYADLGYYIYDYILSKTGFGVSVAPDDGLDNYRLYIQMIINDGDYEYRGFVYYNCPDGNLYYLNENNEYESFGHTWLVPDYKHFTTLKLVIDPVAGKYDKLFFGSRVYDMSDYNLQASASAIPARLELHIMLKTLEDASKVCYVDSVFVTVNER